LNTQLQGFNSFYRIPGASWRLEAISSWTTLRLEHFLIPLPKSRRGYVYITLRLDPPIYIVLSIDVGKVLAGIQVPPNDDGAFANFLQKLGYGYIEETDNKVYRQYLRR
jgi:hypothetical protein